MAVYPSFLAGACHTAVAAFLQASTVSGLVG